MSAADISTLETLDKTIESLPVGDATLSAAQPTVATARTTKGISLVIRPFACIRE